MALQNISFVLTECFGLDSRINKYKGTRPISLYQWDFECLITGIEVAVNDEKIKDNITSNEVNSLSSLLSTIKKIYKDTYG